ncbi:MAG: redoxin domain-containing protein [Aureliella sp.]
MVLVYQSRFVPLFRLVDMLRSLIFVVLLNVCPSPALAKQLSFEAAAIDASKVSVGEGQLSAVCFLGTQCPMARSYATKLSKIQAEFSGRLQVIGVMSNRQDSLDEVKAYAKELDVRFSIVHDTTGELAAQYGATRTPEAFLLDTKGLLRYRGRIDDQYAPGVAKSRSTRNDLKIAIEQLLAGQNVAVPKTEALGCLIGRPQKLATDSTPTDAPKFHENVMPMLIRNCVECHRTGDIGPFPMNDYSEVVGWAETMLETIEDKRMPPWHADASVGEFSNARSIAAEDKQLLIDWIDAGMPQGDPSAAPPMPKYADGWQLSQKPDLVFPMRSRPFVVPADGVVEYQYFVVDPQLEQDAWISAAEIIPGERKVVHHVIVYVRPPDGERFRGIGWLAAYVPGQRGIELPPGYARRVPAGSKFVFQLHYTPTGTEASDLTRLGLVLTDEQEVTHEVYLLAAVDQEFEIPPGASDHHVTGATPYLPDQSKLLSATPHMHLRGKSFVLDAVKKDGSRTALLNVPRYDFNWQHTYYFAQPLDLDQFSELQFDAAFDNSTQNAFNPDPEQWVSWGDQSWEEMALGFFEVAEPRKKAKLADKGGASNDKEAAKLAAEERRKQRIDQYVARAMKGLDVNGDGRMTKAESGVVMRNRFDNWDSSGDGILTEEELRAAARKKFQ